MFLWIATLTSFAVLDYSALCAPFGFFHSYRSLRCYEFRASPSLYRKSASWISFSLVAVVDFAALPSTSHSLPGLAPFSRVVRPKIRRNDECDASLRVPERHEAIHSTRVACNDNIYYVKTTLKRA